uniref:(northern house mosquito) hypothetical protein n=1 Tax=Culex pipiens TaxID=7175 RepID=A0A8D8CW74_CULPI
MVQGLGFHAKYIIAHSVNSGSLCTCTQKHKKNVLEDFHVAFPNKDGRLTIHVGSWSSCLATEVCRFVGWLGSKFNCPVWGTHCAWQWYTCLMEMNPNYQ